MRVEYLEVLDEVTEADAGAGRLRARSTVPADAPVFEGHFPGRPMFPGTLLTEAMAQACGLLILLRNGFSRLPVLMAIDRARFRAIVSPRDVLEISAWIDGKGSGYETASAEIRVAQRPVCDASLRLRLTDELPEAIAFLRARAVRLGLVLPSAAQQPPAR